MEFKINPAAFSNMFPVSSIIVDENIRLAGAIHLKAILYLFRHSMAGENVTCAQIAEATGYSEAEIVDAMIFWTERGAAVKADGKIKPVFASGSAAQSTEKLQPNVEQTLPKKVVEEIPVSKPSHEQIAIRCNECAEFRDLFAEAQQKLGKTIGYEGQATLIMLHDSYGLPIEVILMLIEYAKSKSKTGYSYIAKLGRSWAEMEIDTLEAAEAYIEQQSSTDALWNEFRNLTGVKNANPTTKQRRYFSAWHTELGFECEMIYLAYEISIEATEKMSLAYMDKVLKNWHSKGISTPVDVEKENEKWRAEKNKTAAKNKTEKKDESSYDLDEFTKRSIGLKYN